MSNPQPGGIDDMIQRVTTAPVAGQEKAVRIDAAERFREEIEFLGTEERLFSCRHVSLEHPRAGLLICSPISADFMANYQREVLLARMLAKRGFAVQRFHYRGTGNSDGDPAEVTFGRLCEDAVQAKDELARATGVSTIALLGTR